MSGNYLQSNAVASTPAPENVETIRRKSNCSCSECKLETCFTLRTQYSTATCTCTNECKHSKTCIKFKKTLPDDNDKKLHTKMSDQILIRNKIDEIEKELFQVMTETERSEIDYRKHAQYSCKNISLTNDKIDWNKQDKLYEKSSTRKYIHSASINYLPKEKSAVKLSAQIMNMPYQDFKDSLTFDNLRKSSTPLYDLSKSDIFKRLKEIYEACSCKVCECIATKFPAPNIDPCDCAPCDCEECTNHTKSLTNDNEPRPHSGCPCVKCDRKDCRGVTKNTDGDCDCKPCECVKCIESFHKSCSCEPCQCTECSALGITIPQTIIVAPVHGNFQQNLCQCEPCECAHCTHNYNAMSSNLRREISTGIVHGNCHCESCLDDSCQLSSDVCRCDMQNKVMKKPLDKTSTDYDIHRTLISYRDRNNISSHDTIAMYALSDNYSDVISHSKSKYKNCDCLECQCIVCKSKLKYNEGYKTKGYETLNKYSKLLTDSSSSCKCSPCECQICSRSYSPEKTPKIIHSRITTCVCNKCDCFICGGLKSYPKNDSGQNKSKTTEQLFPKIMNFPSHETFISLKKGKILTPSMFEANILSASKSKKQIRESNHVLKRETKKSCLDVHLNKTFSSKVPRHQTITVCLSDSKHNNLQRVHDKSIKFQNSDFPSEDFFKIEDHITADLENGPENKVYELKKSITLSKSFLDNITPRKLCEPFNLNKQNPIKDIELLDKYIYLEHSRSSKTKIENKSSIHSLKVDLDKEGVGSDLHDKMIVPNVFHKTSTKSMNPIFPSSKIEGFENIHRVEKTVNIIKEDVNLFETIHKASSISIVLCDRKSSIQFEDNDFENNFRNTLENTFKSMREKNTSNSMSVVKNSIDLNKANDFADLKENMTQIVWKDENPKLIAEHIDKGISKQNVQKSLKKSKGKKFNKIYRRIMKNNKVKQLNNKIQENSFSNYIYEDMLSILENLIENISYGINNRVNSVSPFIYAPNTSADNLHTPKNILIDIMDPEIKEFNNMPWAITRKNLFLNSSTVAEHKCDNTIPTMEFNINRALNSISMQTSENSNFAEQRNGKQALTRLLFEVNNLLNSPLLQSSHSSTKSVESKETWNYSPKNKFDVHFKSDVTSTETRSQNTVVDKEVNCNLIHSMEDLQKNIKELTEKIMMQAVYKSEVMTTNSHPTSDLNNLMPKINSVKSSCEGLKAAFVELKTISDHSLMVKWRIPREVIYVQGYELQVDGRSVQKIFSPKRCMAVLTCLPHSEKLILTIRTLTIGNLPSDHYPATTIVYRPRVK